MTTSPTPSPSPAPPEALLAAWQAMLAAEQQAVFGYQVVAAQLRADSDPEADGAAVDLTQHQRRRDVAVAQVVQQGGVPEPAPPAYALPGPVADAAAATDLAARLEHACAQAYADLVAASAPPERARPADWLVAAAGAETRWAGVVPPLPGLGDRSPPLR